MINIVYKKYNSTLLISFILFFLLILFCLNYSLYFYLIFIIISNILFYLFDKKNIFYFFFLSIITINIIYLFFHNNIIETYNTRIPCDKSKSINSLKEDAMTKKNEAINSVTHYCEALSNHLKNKYDNILCILNDMTSKELRELRRLFRIYNKGSNLTYGMLSIKSPKGKELVDNHKKEASHNKNITDKKINRKSKKQRIIDWFKRELDRNFIQFNRKCISENKNNINNLDKKLEFIRRYT